MKILIIYALEEERGNIQIPGCSVVFCCTGLGKVSTAINLYEACLFEKPDLVLNIGTAGTLHHQVGEIEVCSSFLDRDLEQNPFLAVNFRLSFTEEISTMGILKDHEINNVVSTGDTFQTDHTKISTEADVFDMEAFAGAQVCKKLGIPYLSIKYMTDIIGQNSVKHWEEKILDARDGLEAFLKTLRF